MDYTKPDGIGSCRDLSMQNINSSLYGHPRGGARMPSVTESLRMDEMDLKFQIHCIETEAYCSVLRAFIAQSDVLSWGKEGLITELRRELNVTDLEHRELLTKIDSDESIRMIREWRKGASYNAQKSLSGKMNAPEIFPSSVGNASRKKLKTSHAAVSTSWKYVSHGQPSSAAIPSSLSVQFRDGPQSGEMAKFSTENAEQSMKTVTHNIQAPSVRKDRGPVISRLKKGFRAPDVVNFKKRSDMIEIRATDKLIHEVERMIYGRENPDPNQVEKAKLILREHERAILEALAQLGDMSDGDDPPDELWHHYSHEELPGIGQGMATYNDFYGQADRLNGYFGEGFVRAHSDRLRIPCINVKDDEHTP